MANLCAKILGCLGVLACCFGALAACAFVGAGVDEANGSFVKALEVPASSFDIECNSSSLEDGSGSHVFSVLYNESTVSCEDVKVSVTFTPDANPAAQAHIPFRDSCGQKTGKQEKNKEHYRERGAFGFKYTREDYINKEKCIPGKYHVQASEPIVLVDQNMINHALLAGAAGLLGGTGVLFAMLCLGCVFCIFAGITHCVAGRETAGANVDSPGFDASLLKNESPQPSELA